MPRCATYFLASSRVLTLDACQVTSTGLESVTLPTQLNLPMSAFNFSPKKLIASAVSRIINPGKKAIHQAPVRMLI